MNISKEQKDALAELIQMLGLTQAQLAKEVYLSEPTISGLLKLGAKTGTRTTTWHVLTDFLRDKITKQEASLRDSYQLDVAQRYLHVLMRPGSPSEQRIQSPAGVLSANALNYIDRKAENTLLGMLESTEIPYAIVSGGVKVGKSSLVHKLATAAQERNLSVIHIDFTLSLLQDPPKKQDEKKKGEAIWIFKELIRNLSGSENENISDSENLIRQANDCLERKLEREAGRRTLLIIDSMDSLYNFFDSSEVSLLLNWVTNVRLNMNLKSYYNNLSMVVVSGPRCSFDPTYSPVDLQGLPIPVEVFEPNHVKELLNVLDLEEDKSDSLFSLFGGQPYLTHMTAFKLRSERGGGQKSASDKLKWDLSNVEDEAKKLLGIYGLYWRNVRKVLLKVIEQTENWSPTDKENLKEKKTTLLEEKQTTLLQEIINKEGNEGSAEMLPNYRGPLFMLGIIKSDESVACDFYEHAIELELSGQTSDEEEGPA